MFTEFRNAFEFHCTSNCIKEQTKEVILKALLKLGIAFSNRFLNTRVWICKHAVFYRGIQGASM